MSCRDRLAGVEMGRGPSGSVATKLLLKDLDDG
jgi:hypothetical protein